MSSRTMDEVVPVHWLGRFVSETTVRKILIIYVISGPSPKLS
jgi:hypothetical protein